MARPLLLKPISVLVRIGIIGAAAASLVHFVRVSIPLSGMEFDDAYVFVRYAKHALAGHGFSWNISDGPAYGVTSVLYVLAITAVRGLTGMSDGTLLAGSSVLAALLACVALVVLGFLVIPDGFLRRSWAPLAIAPFLLLSGRLQYHSRSGMETTLSLLCNTLVVIAAVQFVRDRSRWRLAACLLTGYISYLTRPDNGLVCLLFAPLFFIASDRRLWRRAAQYVGLFGLLMAVDLAWKVRLFGDAVPLAFYAKQHGFYAGYLGAYKWNAVGYTLHFLSECLPWLVVTIVLAAGDVMPVLGATLLPVAATFGYYLTVTQIMGFNGRYYFPFLPFFVFAALVAIRSVLEREPFPLGVTRLRATWLPRAAAVAGLVLMTAPPTVDLAARAWQSYIVGRPARFAAERTYVTAAESPLPPADPWQSILDVTALLKEAPSTTVIAASEYGYLGSALPNLTIVDVIGLNDRHVAHNGFSVEHLLSRNPDAIWFPHFDYSQMIAEILDSPAFADRYEYYPGAFGYGLAVNTRSPRYAAFKSALERVFTQTHQGRRLSDYQAKPVQEAGHIG